MLFFISSRIIVRQRKMSHVTNSPTPFLLTVVFLLFLPTLSFAHQASAEQLLAAAKSTLASQIEQGLPDKSMDIWLGSLVGKDAVWTWGLNDCGEQTGVPEVDKNRDLPICADLEVIDNDRKIFVYYLVGFDSTGLANSRGLYFVGISEQNTIKPSFRPSRPCPGA